MKEPTSRSVANRAQSCEVFHMNTACPITKYECTESTAVALGQKASMIGQDVNVAVDDFVRTCKYE